MKKKAKILATLGSLCIAIAIMVVGVLAATTAGFDVSSSVSFTSTGVFVKVQGDILKGATAGTATQATAPQGADYDYVGYSYNHANGSDEPNGTSLNPDQASYEMPAWTVGAVSFDEDNQTIVYSFKFSNYSAFPIIATITTNLDEFRTAYGDKLTITESATGSVSIAQDAKDVEYSIALKLNDFSTSLTKALSISMTFAKDESTPASYMAPASLDGFSASTSGNTTTFTKGNETLTISTSTSDSTVKETATFTNNGLTTTYTTTYSTASTASLNASTLSSGYVVKDRTLTRVTLPSSATELVIPDWLGITSIGEHVFGTEYNYKITKITLPSTLKEIQDFAFQNFYALTTINIPDSVTSIGISAFSGCTQIKSTEYGNAYYIGPSSNPYMCLIDGKSTSITSATIHPDTKTICGLAFSGSSLTSITIPEGVKYIGTDAFRNCKDLTTISIADSVEFIGRGVFMYDQLDGYNIVQYANLSGTKYDNAYYLGNSENPYMFLYKASSTSITSCTIHPDTKIIASYAFVYCASLKSISIPNGVTHVSERAFADCSALSTIEIADSVKYISDFAFYATKCTSVTLPTALKEIGESSFRSNSSLTNITIPDGVTKIGESAFQSCSNLKTVTIPASVEYIGKSAFTGVTSVTFKDTTGWWCTEEEFSTSGTELTSSDLSNTTTAGTYLTSNYRYYYWYKY